jgi:Spy/CpxP family protein refolding chaperone
MAVVAVVLVLAAASPVLAQWGHGGRGWGRGDGFGMRGGGDAGPGFLGMLDRMGERLGITAEQRAQIESIVEESRPAIRELRQEIREARQEHRGICADGSFDEAAVRAFAEAQGQRHADLMVAKARKRSRVMAVLTAEQQHQLRDLCESRREEGFGRRDGGW